MRELAVLTVIAGLSTRAEAQEGRWAVASVIAVAQAENSRGQQLLFWIELKNTSATARLLCVPHSMYSFSDSGTRGQTGGQGGGQGGSHACRSEEAFRLVPGGGTEYVLVRASVRPERLQTADVELSLDLTDVQFGQSLENAPSQSITWKGSVEAALNAANRLQ